MTAAEVFARVRFHLNDVGATYFTDAVLMEPVNVALDDLRGELLDNNIPIVNTVSSDIPVDAGITEISLATTPPLPPNLVEIQELLERAFGTSDQFIPVVRKEFLPYGFTPTSEILYWTWQEEKVKLNPANSKRELRFNYLKTTLPDIIGPASNIDMIRAKPFIAYRAAALAAENLGEDPERAAQLNNNAGRELEKLMNLSTKGKQAMPVRRRPFIGVSGRG